MIERSVGAICAVLLFALTGTVANAVPFNITGASFTPGAGYGNSAGELDVAFSTSVFSSQNFALNAVNDMHMFNFGTITLQEPNAMGGIDCPSECDDLGVTANFTFIDPLGSTEMVTAVGAAVDGSVSDADVDYTLTWTPVTVNFGVGGQFQISLENLSFDCNPDCPETQTLVATIKLLQLPEESTAMPEPGALAVFGIGLVGLGVARRRTTARAESRLR